MIADNLAWSPEETKRLLELLETRHTIDATVLAINKEFHGGKKVRAYTGVRTKVRNLRNACLTTAIFERKRPETKWTPEQRQAVFDY